MDRGSFRRMPAFLAILGIFIGVLVIGMLNTGAQATESGTVPSDLATSTIHITYPVGGESLLTFSSYNITWVDSVPDRMYHVYLSNDSGFVSYIDMAFYHNWTIWNTFPYYPYSYYFGNDFRITVVVENSNESSSSEKFSLSPYDFSAGYANMGGGPGLVNGTRVATMLEVRALDVSWDAVEWNGSSGLYALIGSPQTDLQVAMSRLQAAMANGGAHTVPYAGGFYDNEGDFLLLVGKDSTSVFLWTMSIYLGQTYSAWTWAVSYSLEWGWTWGDLSRDPYAQGTVGSGPEPSLQILTPMANETLHEGESCNITWSSSGVIGDVYFSLTRDVFGGSGIHYIAMVDVHTGHYVWNVSNDLVTASDYRLRINSYTISNNSPSYTTPYNFAIQASSAAFINLLAPADGATLQSGRAVDIVWDSQDAGPYVDIFLCKGGPYDNFDSIATGVSNVGTYHWYVSTNLPPGQDYYIHVRSSSILSADGSNVHPVTIIEQTPIIPDLSTDFPTGTSYVMMNSTYYIRLQGVVYFNIYQLELYKQGVWNGHIGEVDTFNGSNFAWTIPIVSSGNDYQVFVHGGGAECLSRSFQIFSEDQNPIQVTAPSAGASLADFTSNTIVWADSIENRTYQVFLFNASGFVTQIGSATARKSMNWTISPAFSGNGFRIQVMTEDGLASSFSGNFSITPFDFANGYPGTQGSAGPISGTKVQGYSGQTLLRLTWNAVVVSDPAASSYLIFRSSQPDLGLAMQRLQAAFSTNLIHIRSDEASMTYYDDSNDSFIMTHLQNGAAFIDTNVIVGQGYWYWLLCYSSSGEDTMIGQMSSTPYATAIAGIVPLTEIAVTSPTGAPVFTSGDSVSISWISQNLTGTVRLELRQGGSNGTLALSIVSGQTHNGTYNWTVPVGLVAGSYSIVVASEEVSNISGSHQATISVASPGGDNAGLIFIVLAAMLVVGSLLAVMLWRRKRKR